MNLSTDIVCNILTYLDFNEILESGCVSKNFNKDIRTIKRYNNYK